MTARNKAFERASHSVKTVHSAGKWEIRVPGQPPILKSHFDLARQTANFYKGIQALTILDRKDAIVHYVWTFVTNPKADWRQAARDALNAIPEPLQQPLPTYQQA